MISKNSLTALWDRKYFVIIPLTAALVGFLDASYLTIVDFSRKAPPCSIGQCERVLTSRYSHILGIPVALLGAGFYAAAILLLVMFANSRDKRLLRWFGWLAIAGFVASLWFLFAQLFLIHAVCQYCLLSEILSTILFALGIIALLKDEAQNHEFIKL